MKGLKALSDLRNCLQAYYTMENVPNIDNNLNVIENELKALEIINEKNINVYWLKTSPNCSRYNLAVGTNQALNKAQYELLKEVLK